MRKINLIFLLVVSSLFMPSIEALERRRMTDLNSLENKNNLYEEVDIYIAGNPCGGGGGGGQKVSDKKKNDLEKAIRTYDYFLNKRNEAIAKGESTTEIDKKIVKWEKKIITLDPKFPPPSRCYLNGRKKCVVLIHQIRKYKNFRMLMAREGMLRGGAKKVGGP